MVVRKATLIQSISEYRSTLEPFLKSLINNNYFLLRDNGTELLTWIIEEELELIYGLFSDGHLHNHSLFSKLHSDLTSLMQMRLSAITKHYIKAPKVYTDNNTIIVKLTDLDITIQYKSTHTNQINFPF